MNTRTNKGEVLTLIVVGIGLLASTQIVPNWRVTNWFRHRPPSKEAVQAQQDLAKAIKENSDLQNKLNVLHEDRQAKQDSLTRDAQEDVAGIKHALESEDSTPANVIASRLADSASLKLALAVGNLPDDKRREILSIVDDILSKDENRVATAEAALAAKDAEARVLAAQKSDLEAQIKAVEPSLRQKDEQVSTLAGKATQLTLKLAQTADKLDAKDRENGSLGAMISHLGYSIAFLAVLALGGFALYAYVKFQLGGVPKAIGLGLSELRKVHPEVANVATAVFDTYLNRHEQAKIAQHASTTPQ